MEKKMPTEIIRKTVRGRDISEINWHNECKEFNDTPEDFFIITVSKVTKTEEASIKAAPPPYDEPQKYPASIKKLVKEAMAEADKQKKEGFDRKKAFDNIFKIQEKINIYGNKKN
ncbi:MAG: hypothetical protein HQK66_12115 [Desulfamplus sp.]|nr:hypothetical protein [Desulfamplus sp.]